MIKNIFNYYNNNSVIVDGYYKIKYGIRNLFRWFCLIWSDRNCDDYFLFLILKYKLELMINDFKRYSLNINNEKDMDDMKLCVKLLNRIIKDDYIFNAFKYHDEKWGEPNLKKDIESIKEDEFIKVNICRCNVKTPEDEKLEKKQFKFCYERASKNKQYDIQYLFNFITKHIHKWWY